MVIKEYQDMNVYEATLKRFEYLFREFENIFVSFSGGKDSGLLLNLFLDYRRKFYPDRRIGVFHQDFEAQYTLTTEYVTRTFDRLENEKNIDLYWVCLPMKTRTALSSYEMYWYPWDDTKEDIWVRKRPDRPYVITIENPFSHYYYKMPQEDLAKQFGRSYKELCRGGKTVCLLGMRADESFQRYSGIVHKKYGYKGECWISRQFKDVWCASPIYDWSNEDVWVANYRFLYDYNKLYDLYYKAGLKIDQMRVASPFNDYAKDSLNLYRVIDPEIWTKLVGRVNGVNFACIYGKTKAMGYRNVTLPKGHTWKSYTKFLLSTLPKRLRDNYIKNFNTSIKFWHETGGGLEENVINDLIDHGYNIRRNGVSNYTVMKNSRVVFIGDIPDDTDDIRSSKEIPSWKRMCYCILKNDHTCRTMGFGLSRQEKIRIDKIRSKYGEIAK